MDKAFRESTPTRERICLNGLWEWQPAEANAGQVPADGWGYFKVPGCWPGITDYLQKDCQVIYKHPAWAARKMRDVRAAWYQREMTVPVDWSGRRISLNIDCLNSYAEVFVDGKLAGELRFPGGEVDITSACRAGSRHVLSLLTVALPLKSVILSYADTAAAREIKGAVERRGLCGDVYLVGAPRGPRITDVKIRTSVRKREVVIDAAIEGLATGARYSMGARIAWDGGVKEFSSPSFGVADLKLGRMGFVEKWMPDRLWDLDTPENTCVLETSLRDDAGRLLDTDWERRFGFREFWIEGRDFYLNGTRIFLSAATLDNAGVGAALATYPAARETLERLKSIGVNFVYTHNYNCQPGSHLGFVEVLKAADDAGMLVGFTQPHFSDYDWQAPDSDENNGYARHAAYYVGVAGNHPSVVLYSMSHNATGYSEDMNPDMIDGVQDDRDTWALKNARLALRAEAIVRRLDPGREVYHHASGNLGSMFTVNFYPNFVPIQELSDWFEHWATAGTKPLFTCEYGAPFSWDWTMYRGWYGGRREFGSARVPWEFCVAEWNAQFLGDRAYQISEAEKADLRWEAAQFRAGNLWHRWDYPFEVGSTRFEERFEVWARYLTDNWRAFRTWGVSGISPWEYGSFWKLRDGVDKSRREFKTDWENLQRPGFSPDYIEERCERMDLAYERSDWIATPAAEALIRNSRPLLAYIAGEPGRFTSKDHNFYPGQTVEKQIVVINNSREKTKCECDWTLDLGRPVSGRRSVAVRTGAQERIPLRFDLPANLSPGNYRLGATFRFSNGETQADTFSIDVLRPAPDVSRNARIALFDPAGESGAMLAGLGISADSVDARADLRGYDILVIGKGALTVDGPAPDISRVREGLKVIVFEQRSEVLERRFGFRVEEYGLRQVFARVPDHPVLAGIDPACLSDWRGEATLLPPRLNYELRPRYGPTVLWCDIPVTRAWRCGNRGNVASVLIEKPARGDFLPIVDGGFSLQYSPLLEYREGEGRVVFCQMDVTGRTKADPAAVILVRNLVRYASMAAPSARREAVYVGDPAGRAYLDLAGIQASHYTGGSLSSDQVLIAGPGAIPEFAGREAAIVDWLKAGGHLLAIGLDEDETKDLVPFKVTMKRGEHIAAWFEPFGVKSLFAGISPADVHNRDPRELPLVSGGARVIGDGVLGRVEEANVVFCQLAPWEFDPERQSNLKRTYRRTSFLLTRLLANMGVAASTPLLERFQHPLRVGSSERRWLSGFYTDQPGEWDDPYRFFRW